MFFCLFILLYDFRVEKAGVPRSQQAIANCSLFETFIVYLVITDTMGPQRVCTDGVSLCCFSENWLLIGTNQGYTIFAWSKLPSLTYQKNYIYYADCVRGNTEDLLMRTLIFFLNRKQYSALLIGYFQVPRASGSKRDYVLSLWYGNAFSFSCK